MNRIFLGILMVICWVGVASALDYTWVGGGVDDNWLTPQNWDLNAIPGLGDTALISGGHAAYIGDPNGTGDPNHFDATRLNIAWGGAGDGHLTIHLGGSLTLSSAAAMGQADNAFTGQITMNGGTLTAGKLGGSGYAMYVGYQDGTGIVNMNGGLIDLSGVLKVGFGTWGAAEVTEGYVYLHGGTIEAEGLNMDHEGQGTGTHVAEMEFDGDGKLILDGNVVAAINALIGAGKISGLGGQTVIAYYDTDLQKTVVRISQGVADCAEAKVLAAVAGVPLIMDLDDDCYVGLSDLALLAADWWLRCYDPLDESCERPWDVN